MHAGSRHLAPALSPRHSTANRTARRSFGAGAPAVRGGHRAPHGRGSTGSPA